MCTCFIGLYFFDKKTSGGVVKRKIMLNQPLAAVKNYTKQLLKNLKKQLLKNLKNEKWSHLQWTIFVVLSAGLRDKKLTSKFNKRFQFVCVCY